MSLLCRIWKSIQRNWSRRIMQLYKKFSLSHAGTARGSSNTTRVLLWFEAESTPHYRAYLETLCDSLGIQGTLGVVPTPDLDQAKAALIIDNKVIVGNAASSWIEGVNQMLSTLPGQLLEYFEQGVPADQASAVSAMSSSGVTRDTSGMSHDA